jgi:hypothetical protein
MIDPIAEQRRQDYLDWLYDRAGRTCCTYTGLYQQRQQELLAMDMAAVAPHPKPLVARVHSCIVGEPECGHMQARAAIYEIAAWLRQQGLDLSAEALAHEA